MFLLSKGEIVKKYKVVFGANPKGHKQKEGDERTPEAKYILVAGVAHEVNGVMPKAPKNDRSELIISLNALL